MIQNLRLAHCKLKTFTTHILDQYRKVKLTTAGNLKTLCGFSILYTQAHICIQLFVKAVTKMSGSNIFSFLAG